MPPLAKRFAAQLLVDIIVWKPSRFSANQMAARAEHRRSGFSLMPFRVLGIVESSRVRGSKHPLARLLGEGGRGGEARGIRRKLCDASTPWPTQRSLSRYWQTALPRHPPTLFWTCYVEYSAVPLARKIFFRLLRIDERKIRHVARESRYLLCNLRKVEAIPALPEFWWHMEGFEINRHSGPITCKKILYAKR